MEKRKKVTEEDIHITEALIADSFSRIKKSVIQAPHDLVRPATNIVKEHPFATTATAAGAGIVAYQLIRLFMPRVVVKEVQVQPQAEVKGVARGRSDMTSQLLSLATPYIASYLQQYVGKIIAGERR